MSRNDHPPRSRRAWSKAQPRSSDPRRRPADPGQDPRRDGPRDSAPAVPELHEQDDRISRASRGGPGFGGYYGRHGEDGGARYGASYIARRRKS